MKFKPQVDKQTYLKFKQIEDTGLNMYSKDAIRKCKESGINRESLDEILMAKSKYKKHYIGE